MLAIPSDVPRVSTARAERCTIELDRALGGSKVLTLREACERYSRDESEAAPVTPDAVVLAESADDVATTLRICEANEVPCTPRGAGTGRTGGAVPVAGGVVLATERLAKVKGLAREDLYVVVEPGVITGELHTLVEKEGLFYPPDPNSLGSCAIGGNIAENAGGPRAFKYGVTREYALGGEAVLMGGTRLKVGKRTVKGVTGYDVMATLVGSEGTLAVFTELYLRLIPKPAAIATILAIFTDVIASGTATSGIVSRGLVPRCLELMDEGALEALRNEGAPVDPRAKAMLLIEVDGDPPLDNAIEQVGEACVAAGAVDVVVAQDAAQRARLWAARRELSPATRRLAKFKLAEDVVVPRSKVGALLSACDRIRDEERVKMLSYGHAGDGNLHVNFLWNDPADVVAVNRAIRRLFEVVLSMDGTISGEHGIGILKRPYIEMEQSQELIALQRRIKRAFDPKELLNPGKIFPLEGKPSHRAC